ncbi:MAG: hypothetical protein KGZ37_10330 [Nitrosarchaeum sp.]|nr:hypothetical protein [Nitrosarchaeum sp.]
MSGISSKAESTLTNKEKYNGKELQSNEFSDGSGLEWTDYGARMYDQQIGRWGCIDIMSEAYSHQSAYVYVSNNPIKSVDVQGMFEIGYNLQNNPKYKEIVTRLRNNNMAGLIHNQHLMTIFCDNANASETFMSHFNDAIYHDRKKFYLNNTEVQYHPVIDVGDLGVIANATSNDGGSGRLSVTIDYHMLDNYVTAAKEDKDAAFLILVHSIVHEYLHSTGRDSKNGAWRQIGSEILVQGWESQFWNKYSTLPHTTGQLQLNQSDGKKYFDKMMVWAKDVLGNLKKENGKKIDDVRSSMGGGAADFLQTVVDANPYLVINVQ